LEWNICRVKPELSTKRIMGASAKKWNPSQDLTFTGWCMLHMQIKLKRKYKLLCNYRYKLAVLFYRWQGILIKLRLIQRSYV
jgi:hypothetical protein